MRVEQLPYYRVRVRDLEGYFSDVYDWDLDLLAIMGVTQGMCPEYDVAPVKHARPKGMRRLLEFLCEAKVIPAGRYVIDTQRERIPQRRIDAQIAAENQAADIRRAVMAATV